MEKELRKKALAGFIVLLLVFGGYCAYLASIPEGREAFLYTFVGYDDSALDSLNISELAELFSQDAFLANYSVNNSSGYHDGIFDIVPIDYPDIVISLCRNEHDIYLMADGFVRLDAFNMMIGNAGNLSEMMEFHMTRVLEHLGHGELADDVYIDDYFGPWPDLDRIVFFIWLLWMNIVYCIMFFFDGGYLLENLIKWRLTDGEHLGIISLLAGIGLGIPAIWIVVRYQFLENEGLFCLSIVAILLIIGLYLIVSERKKRLFAGAVHHDGMKRKWNGWIFFISGIMLFSMQLWLIHIWDLGVAGSIPCLSMLIIWTIFGLYLIIYGKSTQ
ncbi:MAG: hypothetical protein R6W91_01955 [Thermoplasmata archaeon]